ncbi:potassium channel family protein [uncultured Tateyamaria sp.]|uniref:potassium channel family protein n=1 Tax=uncultured Tateyamaria sp. TaxID=455651 RepID=UPI002624E2EB|nr:potassium channel family protein [uncultured Tateyamaria sp.]
MDWCTRAKKVLFEEGPVYSDEAMYFSAVTFSTLGFGDIKPQEGQSRFVASFGAILGNVHLALFAAAAFATLRVEPDP